MDTPLSSRPILGRAVRPILALVTVTATGIIGHMLLAGVGLMEATFWLVDLTSIELHFQDHSGPERATKAFAVAVRVGIILSSLWIGETVLSAAFGGQITEELKQMQTERRIDDLSDHVIICGYGIFGRTLAAQLREDGHDVLVIELDQAEFDRIGEETLAIRGDARREDVLERANVGRASAIIGAIDDSNANIQIAIMASQLSPNMRVIVRVGDEMYESVARRAGADEVVIPEVLSGDTVSEWL
ncbi:potassium channel protein [Halobiforma lacisalsi AJ5]|uniref:Potassium channel protein n=1 Tax=Natronobacterium lacisalsi AJ5 TaxID=358396 RepID=M0LNC7_NATLA|nr:NAD(P)-binding protein [Halobiforma lacisalsi]APW96781.1 potassium channel protein [Halobiforma lacisalsi AJ5]EMA35052.1 TrkA-N domain-containing protein [Halobiforma lacisalsi AJ5]